MGQSADGANVHKTPSLQEMRDAHFGASTRPPLHGLTASSHRRNMPPMPEPLWERDEPERAENEEPADEPSRAQEPDEVPAILRQGNVQERLERIEDGDPLELHARSELQLRSEGLFIDPERLALRAMARVAVFSSEYEGVPGLDEWLDQVIHMSIQDLVREQEQEEFERISVFDSADKEFYLDFAAITKMPAKYGRLACLAMNKLPKEDRLTFWAIVVEGKSINRWVAEGHGPPQKVRQRLRSVGMRVLQIIERAEREGGSGGDTDGV